MILPPHAAFQLFLLALVFPRHGDLYRRNRSLMVAIESSLTRIEDLVSLVVLSIAKLSKRSRPRNPSGLPISITQIYKERTRKEVDVSIIRDCHIVAILSVSILSISWKTRFEKHAVMSQSRKG